MKEQFITKKFGSKSLQLIETCNSIIDDYEQQGYELTLLDELIIPLAQTVGFEIEKVLINSQSFTKTSNIWGVKNNSLGTNTNRIILMRKY